MAEYFSCSDSDISMNYSRDDKPVPSDFKMHTHESYELYYFAGGSGIYRVEGTPYPLEYGDILIMRPAEAHYIDITDIKRTESNRVKSIKVNGKTFLGTKIRSVFGLKSTSFKIKITDDKVIFDVNGYGHGVGMSQYGANGMAKEGSNYKEILTHYYKNCEIKKIN